jgi:RNA recognition motif-containing protein
MGVKLQITNLPRNLTEEQLKKLFEPFGPVVECTLVMDAVTAKSKGFGFVTLPNPTAAEKAVERHHETLVNGQKIKVKIK